MPLERIKNWGKNSKRARVATVAGASFSLALAAGPSAASGTTMDAPADSRMCVACHSKGNPGIVEHWRRSPHAGAGIGCAACHEASKQDADAFKHHGAWIATVVTPRDCAVCHEQEGAEFAASHHAKGGNILASLDNFLAETVEGAREAFNPHSPTAGKEVSSVNGLASAFSGCQQCHGSKLALRATDGGTITVDDLKPDDAGRPTNPDAVRRIAHDAQGRPLLHPGSWPKTGIGRLNLDGSRGSCSACHSRHDFSPRRARQAASATSGPITRRRRSTKSPSTASLTAICAPR